MVEINEDFRSKVARLEAITKALTSEIGMYDGAKQYFMDSSGNGQYCEPEPLLLRSLQQRTPEESDMPGPRDRAQRKLRFEEDEFDKSAHRISAPNRPTQNVLRTLHSRQVQVITILHRDMSLSQQPFLPPGELKQAVMKNVSTKQILLCSIEAHVQSPLVHQQHFRARPEREAGCVEPASSTGRKHCYKTLTSKPSRPTTGCALSFQPLRNQGTDQDRGLLYPHN